jgi:hypothetical protein
VSGQQELLDCLFLNTLFRSGRVKRVLFSSIFKNGIYRVSFLAIQILLPYKREDAENQKILCHSTFHHSEITAAGSSQDSLSG